MTAATKRYTEGTRITFHPGGGKAGRKGTFVEYVDGHPGVVHVRLDTDPFDVCVTSEYVRKSTDRKTDQTGSTQMPTATKSKPKARELRREAKALGVEGWEDMDLDELIEAVDEAKEGSSKKGKKSAAKKGTKKAAPVVEDDDDDDDADDEDDDADDEDDDEEEAPAPKSKGKKAAAKKAAVKSKTAKSGKAAKADAKAAKKASTKKAAKASEADDDEDLPENGNPFQRGSNLYWMAEELIKGGKRSAMVKRLQKKITLNPRTRTFTPEEEAAEIDRRLVIVSQTLRNEHGFDMEREGRGADTVIRLWKD